jgi:hypothetical protein
MGREAKMGDQGARAGVAERPRKGARPMGREVAWSGLFFIYLFIFLSLFSIYFVSTSSDLILSSSTNSQMRRIHNKQIHQSKEICTPA